MHFVSSLHSPTSGGVVALETGRREVTGRNPDHACRPSCSEFSVVFFETIINYGLGSLRKTPHGKHAAYRPGYYKRTIGHKTYSSRQPIITYHLYIFFTAMIYFNIKDKNASEIWIYQFWSYIACKNWIPRFYFFFLLVLFYYYVINL